MYKVSKGILPLQITKLFPRRNEPYNLRHNAEFLQPLVNSVRCGIESISYLGPKIWDMVPDSYKNVDCLYNFKKVMQNLQSFCQKYRVLRNCLNYYVPSASSFLYVNLLSYIL